jgi:hypothetical protein
MHPYLTELMVRDRVAELRGSATSRPARSRSTRRALPRRERVGWLLVTIGMRLVGNGRRVPAHGVG